MSTYPLTSSLKVVKELQWILETTEGTTPSDPVFKAIPTKEFILTPKSDSVAFRKLGNTDVSRVHKLRTDYDISLSYTPVEIDTFLYSMINLIGEGNRENSFTFLISQQHNNNGTLAEMYQIVRGCKIYAVTLEITNGKLVNVQSDWFARSASQWSTSHGLTGTPVFANALIANPWSSTATGANPLTFGGNSYDVRNFSCTINHNTDRVHVLDTNETVRLVPQNRSISIDMDIVYKNTTISDDVLTLTPRAMTMKVSDVNAIVTRLQFENVYLESYDESVDADSTEAKVISYAGFADSVILQGPQTNSSMNEFVISIDSLGVTKIPAGVDVGTINEPIVSSIHSVSRKLIATRTLVEAR